MLSISESMRSRFLLAVAGMGGLLYGIDVGIIAGALPYLESSAAQLWKLSSQQIGLIVAAVLLGSVLSSLAAGAFAEAIGRKWLMFLAGLLFTASIPVIALADGYTPLMVGRLLQGISGGLIGVVVPLYLAETLPANVRGRGTALFQLLLTVGLVLAALIGLLVAREVDVIARTAPEQLQMAKDMAWRRIFWVSLAPGVLFTVCVLALPESPRWLHARGRVKQALAALAFTRDPADAASELGAISLASSAADADRSGSILQRRYVLPFLLACLILICNQATGINSILAYSVTILDQAGLRGSSANMGDFVLKFVNVLMTVVAVVLVDRKGRKFLLMLGSGGIVLSLLAAGMVFQAGEVRQIDIANALNARVHERALTLDPATLRSLAAETEYQFEIAYSYGPLTQVRHVRGNETIEIKPPTQVDGDSALGAMLRKVHLNPFADMNDALGAPLHIERARIGAAPSPTRGWLLLACLCGFIASFAVGPGVCVWLALSELMPTRIRSNGMSVALLLNQFVSTWIAAIFLPTVGQHGYAPMFYAWAACTIVYFLAAALLLPETRGKTLEQVGAHFSRQGK